MALTVRLLARFQISTDDKLIVPLGPRLQALVAYVALHRQTACSRRQVAAALWPETSDEQALKNLRTQITRLRQALPAAGHFIQITTDALQWRTDGDVVLDVARFESAARQAAARRGDNPTAAIELCETALAYYPAGLLPDWYDDWLTPLRDQLHLQFLATLELLSTLLEEQRRPAEAVAAAQRWLRADPVNEAAYALLMRIYLAQADHSAALRTFQSAAVALRDGLDVPPGPLLQELHRQARGHGSRDQPHMARAVADPQPAKAVASEPEFVGRQPELRWLQTAWHRCLGGAAQLALVKGEAGIGKTRLVEEWLARLTRQGIAVATTQCFVGGETLAYAPVAQLLRSACFLPRLRRLEPVWASEVARLLPELVAEDPHVAPPGPVTESWQRQRFLQALTRLVVGAETMAPATTGRRSAQSLQVLFFDDLQWCDGETLGWLAYLMHTAANFPLLVVATLRSEDLYRHATLVAFQLALQRRGLFAEQELGPLTPSDTASLAANVGGRSLSHGEARQLYQNSEGNPLFVVETVRAWPSGTLLRPDLRPPKIQAVVRYRLSQLSSAAQQTAEAASVAGRYFNLALLVAAGSQDEAEAAAGIDELWRRQIIRQVGSNYYEFGHEQLRQVAYESIAPERRRWLHEQIAEALARFHAPDPEGIAGQIAHHYTQSNRPDKALEFCLLAAAAASRMFANDEAIAFYQQAQSLLSQDDKRAIAILEALGELQRRQGNWQAAQSAYSAVLALLDKSDVPQRAALLDRLGRALIASHQRLQAWEALATARTLLESPALVRGEQWHTVYIAVLMGLMEWHYWGGSTDEMAQLVELLQPAVRQYGSHDQQLEWQQLAARVAFRRSRYILSDAMVEERRQGLETVRQLGDPLALAGAQFGYGFTLLWNGRVEQAAVQLRAALHQARQTGLVLVETQCLTYLGIAARLTGQLEEARDLTVLTLESAQASQRLDYVGIARANLAWLAWRSGDLPAAKEQGTAALDLWEEAATGIPFRWLALWPLLGAAAKENRLEQALTYAARLLEDTQQPPHSRIREQIAGALAAWQAGNGLQARAHLDAAAAVAVALGHL